MSFAKFGYVLLLSSLAALSTSPALAQKISDADKAQVMQLMLVNVSGKVAGVQAGKVFVTTSADEQYIIHVFENMANVGVTGTAQLDYLKPGVFVRFTVPEIDKKGNATGELTDFSIYTPSEDIRPSVLSDDVTGEKGPWLVSGRIQSITKKGKATIDCGTAKIKVQFPESPEIKVEVRDYSLAQEGDEVLVTGFLAKPPKDMQGEAQVAEVVGETVEINLAEPLTGAKKKKSTGSNKSS
jgi:hypothetical protein